MTWATSSYITLACIIMASFEGTKPLSFTTLHSDPSVSYGSVEASAWTVAVPLISSPCRDTGWSFSPVAASWVTFNFEGTAIEAHMLTDRDGCVVHALVDDVLQSSYGGINLTEPGVVSNDCRVRTFAKDGLTMKPHNITLIHGGKGWINIRKFVHTTPDPPSGSSPSVMPDGSSVPSGPSGSSPASRGGLSNSAAIGAGIGVLLGGLLIGAIICYFILRQRRRTREMQQANAGAFAPHTTLALPSEAQGQQLAYPYMRTVNGHVIRI